VISQYPPDSQETNTLISELRTLSTRSGLEITLTGVPVINHDVLSTIAQTLPYAACWVFGLTYFILLVLLRSLFLPLKAIFMNVLSLCTSYGVLVYIFQEGHFHCLLHFNPQGILDINLIVIIFCALFGFSMDYEVFLLTRIHEAYVTSKDNNKSIVYGIVKSSIIITSAALIVIVLCGSFMIADVLMVKEFGLGIAVAIFVDAFAIRTLLVPSTMALLKRWNWYLPKWIDRILK
jgi:RND superfamily putative drug exporter